MSTLPSLSRLLKRQYERFEQLPVNVKDFVRPVLVSSLAITALVLGGRHVGILQGLELAMYDRFVRLQPDVPPDDRIVVVGITEQDVQTLQQWPISDQVIADALTRIEAQSPRVIGLDVTRDLPVGEGREALLEVINRSEVVTVCVARGGSNPIPIASPPGVHPDLVGFADLPVDPGGILRRALMWMDPPLGDTSAPDNHPCDRPDTAYSFALQVARYYLEDDGIIPNLNEQNQLIWNDVVTPSIDGSFGGYRNRELNNGYQMMIRYRHPEPGVTLISLMDVLEERTDLSQLSDRIVLIGFITSQAKDEFYTPFSGQQQDDQKMPGVLVHAQVIRQILGTVLDGETLIWAWGYWAEALWIFGWSLLGGAVAWYIRQPLPFGVSILGGGVVLVGGSFGLFLAGGWVPFVPGAIALFGTSIGVIFFDRFNKSDYGKAVYKQVKTLLKIDIEINQQQVKEEVDEITGSEYFSELKLRAQDLRAKRHTKITGVNPNAPRKIDDASAPSAYAPRKIDSTSPAPGEEGENSTEDFLLNVQRKAKSLREQRNKGSEPVGSDRPTAPKEPEIDAPGDAPAPNPPTDPA